MRNVSVHLVQKYFHMISVLIDFLAANKKGIWWKKIKTRQQQDIDATVLLLSTREQGKLTDKRPRLEQEIDKTGKRYLKLATKWKTSYLLGCWLRILSGNILNLWLLGVLVYLTLFGIYTVNNSWCVNWIYRYCTSNILYFGLSLICVVWDIDKTGTRSLKLATKWKTNYLLGCWIHISSSDSLHLWLSSVLVHLTLFGI